MSTRTTIVALVLMAAGLAVFLIAGQPPAPEGGAVDTLYPDFLAADVTDLSWGVGDGSVRVRRGSDGFQVAVGEHWDAAASGKVEEILSDLTGTLRRSVIDGSTVDAGSRQDYGLDPALGWIAFTIRGEEKKLLVGRETLKRDTVYAQHADERDVLVVDDAAWKTVVPLTVSQLRERRVVPFVVDDLDRITVKEGTEVRISGVRAADFTWSATIPFADYLDQTRFTSELYQALAMLETDEFVTEAPTEEELAGFGLVEPRYTVEVHRKRGAEETVTVLIGADVPEREGYVYFKRADRPFVSTGAGAVLLAQIRRDPAWYRDTNVARLGWAGIEKFRVTSGESSFTAEKDHGEWHLVEPEVRLLEAEAVRGYVDAFRDLAATDFVDGPDLEALGLADPALRFEFYEGAPEDDGHGHEDGDEAAEPAPVEPILTLLVSAPAEDGTRRAIRVGHEATVYVLAPTFSALVPDGFWPFLPGAVFPDAPGEEGVLALERTLDGEVERIEQVDGAWPEGMETVPLTAVISRLLGLFANPWVGPAEGKIEEYGLGETAAARIELTFAPVEEDGPERRVGVVIGAETVGGRFARPVFDGEPGDGVFVLAPDDFDRLTIPIK